MRFYLAGPMRGFKGYNHSAFDGAAYQLREEGHEVFSPAEEDRKRYPHVEWHKLTGNLEQDGLTHIAREVIKNDLITICEWANAMAFLPGWEFSRGVAVEHPLAVFLNLHRRYL